MDTNLSGILKASRAAGLILAMAGAAVSFGMTMILAGVRPTKRTKHIKPPKPRYGLGGRRHRQRRQAALRAQQGRAVDHA